MNDMKLEIIFAINEIFTGVQVGLFCGLGMF